MEATEKRVVTIAAELIPDYYPEFHCLADKCRNSCCQDWTISLTKNDYMTLRRSCKSEELKHRLEGATKRLRGEAASERHYADFQLQEGNCPFWTEGKLCAFQLECGHQVLPRVCRTFPRNISPSPSGVRECSCTLGCEAVLPLLYRRREGLGFLLNDLPAQEHANVEFSGWGPWMEHHAEVQSFCIDLLQDRTLPISRRLLMLGWVLRDMAARKASDEPWDVPGWLARKRTVCASPDIRHTLEGMEGNQDLFVINNLKQISLMPSIPVEVKRDIQDLLGLAPSGNEDRYQIDLTRYQSLEAEFAGAYGDLEYFFENLMVNVFFHDRYPSGGDAGDIWQNYMNLCNAYATTRFLAVCHCHGHSDLEQLFDAVTLAARGLLHSPTARKTLAGELTANGNAALADMAILVCG